jgi:hypothetical protein
MMDLPADVSRWPQDPHQLFGLGRGFKLLELRSAYARLIRQYKPEQHPEEFRRIRDAYESLTAQAREKAHVHARTSDSGNGSPAWTATPADQASLDTIWAAASMNGNSKAYRQLIELQAQQPHQSEIAIALYWMLTIDPALDARRSAMDWLMRAATLSRGIGPARELLQRDMTANPAFALSAAFDDFLAGDLPAGVLGEWIGWRWRWNWPLRGAHMVVRDLDRFRDRFAGPDVADWARLLIMAIKLLTWARSRKAKRCIEEVQRELKSLSELQLRMSAELDQLDETLAVSADWHRLFWKSMPREVIDLIPTIWIGSPENARNGLLDLAAKIIQDRYRWLARLTRVQNVAGAVVAQLCNSLVPLHVERKLRDARPDELRRRMVSDFFDGQKPKRYSLMRKEVLQFCLDEVIDPRVAEQVTVQHPITCYVLRTPLYLFIGKPHLRLCRLYDLLTKDLALRCVWLAHLCLLG